MGNIEKLVVLTVLFLSVVVLAVSLSENDEADGATDPLSAARDRAGQELPEEDQATPADALGLLSAEVETPPGTFTDPGAQPEPAPKNLEPKIPQARADGLEVILQNEEGLSESWTDDYRVYRIAEGDTWHGLSQRFYAKNYVAQLKAANEELEELVAGDRILVPVVDLTAGAGERAPYEPTPRPRADEPAPKSTADTYVVVNGDNLSRISEKLFGTQKHWRAIYEANKDRLESEDDLDLGQELVIPAIASE